MWHPRKVIRGTARLTSTIVVVLNMVWVGHIFCEVVIRFYCPVLKWQGLYWIGALAVIDQN